MVRDRGVCWGLALCWAFSSFLGFGQTGERSQAPPQFKAGVVLVPVDVRVVDKSGNPVSGLTAADFLIYDNNVRQEIAHFLPQSVPTAPRTFVIALGRGRLNVPGGALDVLIEFVRSKMLPQDRVGVIAYYRATELTTDHEAVARLLERFRERHESIELKYEATDRHPTTDLPLSEDLRSSIEALFSAPGLPAVQVLPGGNGARGWYYYTDSLRVVRAIQFLSRLEGEKHLVFVSERPLPAGLSDSDHAKLAAATRVALWLMQTGGVQASARPQLKSVLTGGRAAAEQSGGLASVYENPAALLAQLDRMTSHQYLLGYYPSSPPAENTFGSIRVVVNRRDVRVLHRHSYVPKTRFDEADLRRFFLEARVEQALSWLRNPPRVIPALEESRAPRIKVSALVTPAAAGEIQIKIELAFDPTRLIFTQQGNDLLARRDLVVVVDGADQIALARSTDRLEITVDAREYARRNEKWPEHQLAMTVKGNPAHVRAVLYDYDTDNTLYGTVRVRR
jgi:VWFA-related protein